MAGATYVSPFTPETQIGAGLQNIALALTGKRANEKAMLNAQQGDMYTAHGDLYRERTRQARVERQLAERLLRDQSGDSQDELIAADAGVPAYTVRGYRDALNGMPVEGSTLDDYKEIAPRISRAMLAIKPAYADKTINPVNIAQARDMLRTTDTREGVLSGKLKPQDVANAFFSVSGKAPFSGSETGSTNLTTGEQALNPLGSSRAFEYNQRGRVSKLEADSGVRVGAPVAVDDPEAGVVFTAPSSAIGRRVGLNPNSAGARPAGRGAGDATTETDLKPMKIGQQDANLLLGGIDRAVGGQLADPILTGAVLQRAQAYFSTPGSPSYGQHEGAARQAVMDVLPEGANQNWGFGKYTPKGDPRTNLGPIALTGPTKLTRTTTRSASAAQPNATPGGAATGRTSPAAAAAGQSKALGRPAGKTDEQLVAEANNAIAKGAQREQVLQRLKSWGVALD